jgi:N-acetylmuramoyl-L-alanine amidase
VKLRLTVILISFGALTVSPQQSAAPPAAPSQAQAQPPAAPQPPAGSNLRLTTVVLDPAHGGPDAGARGAAGILEKEATLALARLLKSQLEARGLTVVLTREGDDNPSFDERAARANAQAGAIFISLHISSTGSPGTARAYYFPPKTAPADVRALARERPPLLPWDEAQQPFVEQSRRIAELVQIQLGQKLAGSPEVPSATPLRQLRSIAAPAVAIELASVSMDSRQKLESKFAPLAEGVVRAVTAFQPLYAAGVP